MRAIEIHSVWKRRVLPAEDDGWNFVEIIGVFEQPEGMAEVCLRQVNSFGRVLSVPPADLEAHFDLERPAAPEAQTDMFDTGSAWL